MDNVVYYMLQSCGVQARNYLRTGKINLTYLASKELFRLANSSDVTISQRMDYFSMIWTHRVASLEYKHLEDVNFDSDGLALGRS